MIKMKLLEMLFGKHLDNVRKQAFQEGIRCEKQSRDDARIKTDQYIAQDCIGMKGIFIPNEWVDPNFFTITGSVYISKGSQLAHTYTDALTGEEGIALIGTVLPADEKMVKAILKLDPFERWNLCSSKNTLTNMWSKSYPLGEITDSDTLYRKLKEVSFV